MHTKPMRVSTRSVFKGLQPTPVEIKRFTPAIPTGSLVTSPRLLELSSAPLGHPRASRDHHFSLKGVFENSPAGGWKLAYDVKVNGRTNVVEVYVVGHAPEGSKVKKGTQTFDEKFNLNDFGRNVFMGQADPMLVRVGSSPGSTVGGLSVRVDSHRTQYQPAPKNWGSNFEYQGDYWKRLEYFPE